MGLKSLFKKLSKFDAYVPLGDAKNNGKTTVFAFKINTWKRDFIAASFPEYNWVFVGFNTRSESIGNILRGFDNKALLFWGYNEDPVDSFYAGLQGIAQWRMEDGFVRSVGLGVHHTLPLSLIIDKSGTLYFDSRLPSGLEKQIVNDSYSVEEYKESKAIIDIISGNRLSKYNTVSDVADCYYDRMGHKKAESVKRILVIGQVEGDASIRFGGCGYDNGSLVKAARRENPDAQIYFKPHPDVLAGKRETSTPLSDIAKMAHVITEHISIDDSFRTIDEVYVISSLTGFEALLRGIKVVVAGRPFYGSWGLTEDLNPIQRRIGALALKCSDRQTLLLHVFRAAYIGYPEYLNANTHQKSTLVEVIGLIGEGRKSA